MKRIYLIVLAVAFATSSCQEEETQLTNDYQNQISALGELYSTSLNGISLELKNGVSSNKQDLSALRKDVFVNSANFIDMHYFTDHEFSKEEINLIAESSNSFLEENSGSRLLQSELIDNGHYTPAQVELIEPLVDQLMAEDFLNTADQVITNFNQSVINSDLTDEQKFELFSIGAASLASADFLNNGGIELIASELNITYSSNGRVMGCSVSSRNVLASAVVGLAGGAATGGYFGATAGTFTVPILGTAIGGVGGAVFGGAAGFVGGLISGVAAELLTSCGR